MENTKNNGLELKVFVTDLNAYNNGELVGKWFDALTELDDAKKYAQSFKGEYFISDFESDVKTIDTYTTFDELEQLADSLNELNGYDYPTQAIELVADMYNYIDDVVTAIENDIIIIDGTNYRNLDHAFGTYLYYERIEHALAGASKEADKFGWYDEADALQTAMYYFDCESYGHDQLIDGFTHCGDYESDGVEYHVITRDF